MFSNPLFFFEQFLKNIYHLEQKQLKSKFNLMFKSVLYLIIFYIYWNSIQFHFLISILLSLSKKKIVVDFSQSIYVETWSHY